MTSTTVGRVWGCRGCREQLLLRQRGLPGGSEIWREDLKEAKKSWKRPSGHLNNLYGHKDGRRGLEKWAMVRCSQKQKVGWGERKADDGG